MFERELKIINFFGSCLLQVTKVLRWSHTEREAQRRTMPRLMALFHCMVRHGTVHFWGVFHWVLYLVPGTFLVPPQPRFQASRTVTKTWRVNSTDHWLAGENHHYCVTELVTRDPPLQPDPLDLNQHSQRRIGRNFCLNKRTFLHQPQNSCRCLLRKFRRSSRW